MGVSTPTPPYRRILHRSGGPASPDALPLWTASENCSELCYYGMRFIGLNIWWYEWYNISGNDPYYLKCFDAPTASPPNSIRIQTASQLGTNEVDPLLPRMNVTDVFACFGMLSKASDLFRFQS